MGADNLTDKQKAVLLVLADRTGGLSTNELCDLVARAGMNDDDFPELDRMLSQEQAVAVGRQLVRKGLATESGVKFGPKSWRVTDAGRARRDRIRGLI